MKVLLLLLLLVLPYKSFSQTVSIQTFTATAYCLQGITAKGHSVQRGIIAVDPQIIPLNSIVFINGPLSVRGYYIASDTGKIIKGKLIDIWMPTCSEARNWGRRDVTLVINPDMTKLVFPVVKLRGANLRKLVVHLGPKRRINKTN